MNKPRIKTIGIGLALIIVMSFTVFVIAQTAFEQAQASKIKIEYQYNGQKYSSLPNVSILTQANTKDGVNYHGGYNGL